MPRGYLANLMNVPPLIFRFQYNPELLSERKSHTYNEGEFGLWKLEKTSGAQGLDKIFAFFDDVTDVGSLLVNTKPLEPKGGEQRVFSIDFVVDARTPGPEDGESRHGGSIEPDLAVLRSFVNPAWTPSDIVKVLRRKDTTTTSHPPGCSLIWGGHNLSCVMTDLNIKMTAFFDDGKPARADVSVTLKEQTRSVSTTIDLIKRHLSAWKVLKSIGVNDLEVIEPVGTAAVTAIVSTVTDIFS